MARRAGWALFALTCALCAAQAILIIASDVPFWSVDVLVGLGFPLVSIGAILGAAIGALIIARDPRNAIGWLFAVGQLGSALGILSDAAIHYVTTTGEPGGDSVPLCRVGTAVQPDLRPDVPLPGVPAGARRACAEPALAVHAGDPDRGTGPAVGRDPDHLAE